MIWYDVRWCDVMWCLPNSHVSTQKKSASQVTLQTAYPKNKPWRFATSHSKVFVRSWKEKSYPKTSPYYFCAWENCLLWAAVSRCPPPPPQFFIVFSNRPLAGRKRTSKNAGFFGEISHTSWVCVRLMKFQEPIQQKSQEKTNNALQILESKNSENSTGIGLVTTGLKQV